MSRSPAFVPFEHGITADKVIGLSSGASALDLNDEAILRQTAANHLLSVLSGFVDFEGACRDEISGCFLAVKILAADAAALRDAADEPRLIRRHGDGQ